MRRVNGLKFKNNMRMWIGVLCLAFILTVPFLTPVQKYLSIPNDLVTLHDQTPLDLPSLGESVSVHSTDQSVETSQSSVYAHNTGESELVYEVAGLPVKKVNLSLLEDVKVIPGGQSIGVQLQTQGVLVVGHHLVNGKDGQLSPGEDAKVKVGDIILTINDQAIEKMEDVKPIVEKAGDENKPLELLIKRGNKEIETTLEPAIDDKEKEYRIGLYIRDSAAGIGTMSFYEPESKKYGALGHVITDMDTKKAIEIHNGSIVRSSVTSIEKGNNGSPGEKQAKFSIKDNEIGSITKNSPFGIFGKLTDSLDKNEYNEPMSIGLSHEVKEGPATILTVVEGEEVEEYDVEIVNSVPQKFPETKGMVIRITDSELLEKTGGIVQGMSGSPIIQNDKIVGAVTHVFVNDPTSGYGVHIEWMLEEAGIKIDKE